MAATSSSGKQRMTPQQHAKDAYVRRSSERPSGSSDSSDADLPDSPPGLTSSEVPEQYVLAAEIQASRSEQLAGALDAKSRALLAEERRRREAEAEKRVLAEEKEEAEARAKAEAKSKVEERAKRREAEEEARRLRAELDMMNAAAASALSPHPLAQPVPADLLDSPATKAAEKALIEATTSGDLPALKAAIKKHGKTLRGTGNSAFEAAKNREQELEQRRRQQSKAAAAEKKQQQRPSQQADLSGDDDSELAEAMRRSLAQQPNGDAPAEGAEGGDGGPSSDSEHNLAELVSFGFSKEQARRALDAHGNDVERAANALFDGGLGESSTPDVPPPAASLPPVGGMAGGLNDEAQRNAEEHRRAQLEHEQQMRELTGVGSGISRGISGGSSNVGGNSGSGSGSGGGNGAVQLAIAASLAPAADVMTPRIAADDEDEELKRVLALSREPTNDALPEDEDADLARALQESRDLVIDHADIGGAGGSDDTGEGAEVPGDQEQQLMQISGCTAEAARRVLQKHDGDMQHAADALLIEAYGEGSGAASSCDAAGPSIAGTGDEEYAAALQAEEEAAQRREDEQTAESLMLVEKEAAKAAEVEQRLGEAAARRLQREEEEAARMLHAESDAASIETARRIEREEEEQQQRQQAMAGLADGWMGEPGRGSSAEGAMLLRLMEQFARDPGKNNELALPPFSMDTNEVIELAKEWALRPLETKATPRLGVDGKWRTLYLRIPKDQWNRRKDELRRGRQTEEDARRDEQAAARQYEAQKVREGQEARAAYQEEMQLERDIARHNEEVMGASQPPGSDAGGRSGGRSGRGGRGGRGDRGFGETSIGTTPMESLPHQRMPEPTLPRRMTLQDCSCHELRLSRLPASESDGAATLRRLKAGLEQPPFGGQGDVVEVRRVGRLQTWRERRLQRAAAAEDFTVVVTFVSEAAYDGAMLACIESQRDAAIRLLGTGLMAEMSGEPLADGESAAGLHGGRSTDACIRFRADATGHFNMATRRYEGLLPRAAHVPALRVQLGHLDGDRAFSSELELRPCSLRVDTESSSLSCLLQLQGRGDAEPAVYRATWPKPHRLDEGNGGASRTEVRLLLQWDGEGEEAPPGDGAEGTLVAGGVADRFALLVQASEPPCLSRLDASSRLLDFEGACSLPIQPKGEWGVRPGDPTDTGAIGRCRCYRFVFHRHQMSSADQTGVADLLRTCGLIDRATAVNVSAPAASPDWRLLSAGWPRLHLMSAADVGLLQRGHDGCELPRRVRYELQVLVCSGALLPHHATDDELLVRLEKCSRVSEEGAVRALRMMRSSQAALDCRAIDSPISEFERCARLAGCDLDAAQSASASEVVAPDAGKLVQVPRVAVTPSRVVVLPAEYEASNRVLRHADFGGAMLRVSFVADDFGMLWPPLGDMKDRIREIFEHGLDVVGEKYLFVAYGQTQLKERAAWFVRAELGAGSRGATAADLVRAEFGFDFPIPISPTFPSAAKCAARIAQVFSTTQVGTLDEETWRKSKWGYAEDEPDLLRDRDTGQEIHRPASCPTRHAESLAKLAEWQLSVADRTRNFSDGCGKISSCAMAELRKASDERAFHDGLVSAVQFRWRGCKGMLSVDPRLVALPHQTGVIWTRPSQNKFHADETRFELHEVASWKPAHLHRQLVRILSDRGVPYEAFETLQCNMTATLDKALGGADGCDDAARLLLWRLGARDDNSSVARSMLDVALHMLEHRWRVEHEPWLRAVLSAVRAKATRELRDKCRIVVPRGALLKGVIDELGVVPAGQIFVQISSRRAVKAGGSDLVFDEHNSAVVAGTVALSKAPCHHPGDVLIVGCFEDTERKLRHHHNVVVFSQLGDARTGHRPLQHQTSGGDLDGDEFTVLWEPSLVRPRGEPLRPHPPMEYDVPLAKRDASAKIQAAMRRLRRIRLQQPQLLQPHRGRPRPSAPTIWHAFGDEQLRQIGMPPRDQDLSRTIQVSELHDFFLEYIQNDNLGRISASWLALADSTRHRLDRRGTYDSRGRPDRHGIYSSRCLSLAALASRAVDYQKNGEAVSFPSEMRPLEYPHYMGKEASKTYHSRTELGRLFDLVASGGGSGALEGGGEAARCEYDGRLFDPKCAEHVGEAVEQLGWYRGALAELMAQYGVADEAALLCGQVAAFDQPRRGSTFDIQQRCTRAVHRLQLELRRRYARTIDAAGSGSSCPVAAAWYLASYARHVHAVDEGGPGGGGGSSSTASLPPKSFAWVALPDLIMLKAQNADRPPVADWRHSEAALWVALEDALETLNLAEEPFHMHMSS